MGVLGAYPVNNITFKIGTKGVSSADEDMKTIADMESFEISIDDNTEEWYPMEGGGTAKALNTGAKYSVSLSGKRSVGDAGNDYVAGLAWKRGLDRKTKFEFTLPDDTHIAFPEAMVSFSAAGGGDSNAIGALEFEVTCCGNPTVTTASASTTA